MNSLQAFLSPCTIINTESDLRTGALTVLIQNGQPVHMFDRTCQTRPFVVALIDDPESLGERDVVFFSLITEQPEWLVVMDRGNQVRGIIEPKRTKDLRVAANATIKRGEFSSKITLPPGDIEVTVSYYGCHDHPEAGRFALAQIGSPIPNCPDCGKPMTKLEEKKRSRAKSS